MANLYKVVYTQESEAYVRADSEDEAVSLVSDYTSNGGSNMNNIRLNECEWTVEEDLGELKELDDNDERTQFDTHITSNGWSFQQQDQDWLFYN